MFAYGADFDPHKTIDKIHCFKRFLPYYLLIKLTTAFLSKKDFREMLAEIKTEFHTILMKSS